MKIKAITKVNMKRAALVIGVIYLALFGLSSLYYKTSIIDPVAVWHGANLSVLSLTSSDDSKWADLNYDKELLERVNQSTKHDLSGYKLISTDTLMNSRVSDIEIKNQIAANQARQAQLEKDTDRLNKANAQLLNSKKVLDDLNQDFSSTTVYQQSEQARKNAIENALEEGRTLPSKADAKDLMAQSGLSRNRTNSGIPKKVLKNVQQTTGISPEEINELMNQ